MNTSLAVSEMSTLITSFLTWVARCITMEQRRSAKPWAILVLLNLAKEANVQTFLEHGGVNAHLVMVEVAVNQVNKWKDKHFLSFGTQLRRWPWWTDMYILLTLNWTRNSLLLSMLITKMAESILKWLILIYIDIFHEWVTVALFLTLNVSQIIMM